MHPFYRNSLPLWPIDRKSTRLNSSHGYIPYAVFCLKKKNVRELSLLRDGPVHFDRVFVGERDLRLPTRSFRDLHRVVHDRAHVRLRAAVRGPESEPAVDEDAHPDPAVLAHVECVEDPVLQDEVL